MRKLALPRISERIRGFTPPEAGGFFVFDYDEVHKVSLSDPPTVETLDDDPYAFADKAEGFFGVSDRPPISSVDSKRVSYNFDPTAKSVTVKLELPEGASAFEFRTFSGDWFVATFSPCGNYLLVAEPYLIEVYDTSSSEA
jgi:hypothetical protein